jgi:hypothetical protein
MKFNKAQTVTNTSGVVRGKESGQRVLNEFSSDISWSDICGMLEHYGSSFNVFFSERTRELRIIILRKKRV